jgi:hypothetical protein
MSGLRVLASAVQMSACGLQLRHSVGQADLGVGGLAAVGHRAAKAVHGRDPDRGDDSDRDESRTQTVDEGRRRGVPASGAEHGADQ